MPSQKRETKIPENKIYKFQNSQDYSIIEFVIASLTGFLEVQTFKKKKKYS